MTYTNSHKGNYANIFAFGNAINNNIKYPNSAANPLTYAVMPNYNTQFNHGSTANYIRPWTEQSAIYMKELANGMHGATEYWNTYCQAYYAINKDTTKPNLGAINKNASRLFTYMANPANSVGQNLLRNTLELYCVHYPSAIFLKKPFDPNVANSPLINIPTTLCGNCPAIIHLPQNPDNDNILNAVLEDPLACTDVLCYIWAAIFRPFNPYNIRLADSEWANKRENKESKLHTFFSDNKKKKYYNRYFEHIMKALGESCNCAKCEKGCNV